MDDGARVQSTPETQVPTRASGKAIALFADGTGNAFARRESNIWRMYDAIDVGSPAQIAHYIPGVGTSGFRPWALVDGATGFGVPSNVRRLYEFLCWNYLEGDRIYLFGFSRGAFTVRVLIGMVDSEGLLSREGRNGTASRPEMRRNVRSAWRAYRSRGVRTLREEAPTIKLARRLRDAVLSLRDLIFRYERYRDVKKRSDLTVRIRFSGLFDTVEAYGVPVEEMRDAIDWAVWPIKFRDRVLSDKVDVARHALSLDDERQTFHPVRFDLSDPSNAETGRIKEVWFAGSHSDVGGGYPEDQAALVPLNWMLHQLSDEIAFKAGTVEAMRDAASSLAATHDSRSGLGVLYRYYPRLIDVRAADGGAPVVHHSVIEKMVFGSDRYAPHTLPEAVRVLMPDGSLHAFEGFGPDRRARRTASAIRHDAPPDADAIAQRALDALGDPNKAYVAGVHDAVWMRRKTYFLLLTALLALASLPWTSSFFGSEPGEATGETLTAAGYVNRTNHVLSAWLQDVAYSITDVVPAYAHPWLKAVVAQPLLTILLLTATFVVYSVNGRLKDRIEDDARCAWFGSGAGRPEPTRSWAMMLVGWLRSRAPTPGNRGCLYWFWFAATLCVVAAACFLYLDRVWLSYRVGSGELCRSDPKQKPRPVRPGRPETAEGFAPDKPCWDTGLFLEQGRAYSFKLVMTKPFMDRSLVADVDGFSGTSWRHRLAAPLKRWFSAPYFQVVARIGSEGASEFLLRQSSGEEPRASETAAEVRTPLPPDVCAPVVADPNEVKQIKDKLNLSSILTSLFVAPSSGELFIYVNDVLLSSEFLAKLLFRHGSDCFYRNNSGEATITVEQIGSR